MVDGHCRDAVAPCFFCQERRAAAKGERAEFAVCVDFEDGAVGRVVDGRFAVAVVLSGAAAFEDAGQAVDAVRAALVALCLGEDGGNGVGVCFVVASGAQGGGEQGVQFFVAEVLHGRFRGLEMGGTGIWGGSGRGYIGALCTFLCLYRYSPHPNPSLVLRTSNVCPTGRGASFYPALPRTPRKMRSHFVWEPDHGGVWIGCGHFYATASP